MSKLPPLIAGKRILHMTLKKHWFELIATGRKKVEYRELKDYWIKRLMRNGIFIQFDEIHFKNGYQPNAPFMRVEFIKTIVDSGKNLKPMNGEDLQGRFFAIHLGEVLETLI